MIAGRPALTSCFVLLLTLSVHVLASSTPLATGRRLDDVEVPSEAEGAYCNAITGWYDGCIIPSEGRSFCDGVNFHPLQVPLFIDFKQCYSNPHFGRRSISFFGETPDKTKVIEFHLIFKTNNTDELKGVNCTKRGTCVCSEELLSLKQDFLNAGKCDTTDDYSCLYEDFWGVNEQCFVPATLEFQSDFETGIWCSMAAKVEQYGPCDTELDIPTQAYDANCTAITGWYRSCGQVDDNGEDVCNLADYNALEKPVFIDLDSCYSNPHLDQQSVTFFGLSSGGKVKEYDIIFKSSGADEFRPLNCDEFGVCAFSDGLLALKDQFDLKGGCQDDPDGVYTCVSKDFAGVTERCFVPSKLGQSCSMAARLEHFGPCDKSELGFGEAETITDPPGGPGTVAAGPVSSPTTSPPTSPSAEGGNAASSETSNLVINGWWTDCTQPTEAEPDSCRGGNLVAPADGAILINFDSCYANPNFDPRGVSFYSVDGSSGDVIGFHLLFASDAAYSLLAPTDCNGGVCYCSLPTTLRDLRLEILDQGSCGGSIIDGVKCVSEKIISRNEACYVPIVEDVSTPSGNKLYCAMAADVNFQVAGATFPTQDSDSSGLPAWAIVLITLVVLFFLFVLTIGFVRYRRTGEFFSPNDEEEEVWVTPRPHDYKFTRRALNTEEAGDGVWKQSNIHDLKFQMTS
ncbi:hypothetical protein MHU86_18795 [Fragilaria crotonensis]|nr:hypothetical protein MHU86_18795 [Fragilaria crotonensis]